jgi:hypothetical protein
VKEVAMEVEADQTERINIQEVDQIQMKNAAYMAGISGASATRILEATIIIPPEETEEMDKVETIPAMETMEEEADEDSAATTITLEETLMSMNITTWMVSRHKATKLMAKEPTSKMLSTIILT